MTKPVIPVSARLAEALGADHPLVKDVGYLESVSAGQLAFVGRNNTFPHWPIERWISVIGFASTFIAIVFVAGNKWQNIETGQVDLTKRVSHVEQVQTEATNSMGNLTTRVTTLEAVRPLRIPSRTPVFPREDHFAIRDTQ